MRAMDMWPAHHRADDRVARTTREHHTNLFFMSAAIAVCKLTACFNPENTS